MSGVVSPHDFTLEGWFNTTTRQDELVVSIGLGGSPHSGAGVGVWDGGGVPTVAWDTYDGETGLATGSVDPYDGRWQFVAGTYDARTQSVTLYPDGNRLGTSPMPTDPTESTVRIGYWVDTAYNQPFEGSLAQIAIFDSALTAGQIAAQWRPCHGDSGDVSSVASSLPTPAQAFANAGEVVASIAVAAGGTLFITFPAQLFNLTFQENYDLIVAWLRRRSFGLHRRGGASPAAVAGTHADGHSRSSSEPSRRGWTDWRTELLPFAAVVVVGATSAPC